MKAEPVVAQTPVWDAIRQAMDLTLVALAGEQAGAAQRCLSETVEYAKTRIQFGRAIGSLQAVKHMAADLLLETESAISAARNAAARLAEDADDATEAVSLAAFACADAFVTTAATSIQMHGGIGMTDEFDIGFFIKRSAVAEQTFANVTFPRTRYGQLGGY